MKTKLTRELIFRAAELLREGTPQKYVAQALGIDESTWYDWLRRGAKGKSIFSQFYKSVKKAQGEAVHENLGIIRKAAKKNWVAAAWILERTHPEEFGRKSDVAVHGKGDDNEIEIVIKKEYPEKKGKHEKDS